MTFISVNLKVQSIENESCVLVVKHSLNHKVMWTFKFQESILSNIYEILLEWWKITMKWWWYRWNYLFQKKYILRFDEEELENRNETEKLQIIFVSHTLDLFPTVHPQLVTGPPYEGHNNGGGHFGEKLKLPLIPV